MYFQLGDMVRDSVMTEMQAFQHSLQVGTDLFLLVISKALTSSNMLC